MGKLKQVFHDTIINAQSEAPDCPCETCGGDLVYGVVHEEKDALNCDVKQIEGYYCSECDNQ